jgi:hypothetical protein
MRTLLFLSRVAVLMNVMFLLFIAGRFNLIPLDNNYLKGLIITTGWGISLLFNIILHPILFVMLMIRRAKVIIPAWIIIFNLFCFIFQIFFYFFS